MLRDIVENKVACAIDNIKTNSAPGPDGIPPKFIKMSKVVLVPVFTKLYVLKNAFRMILSKAMLF